MVKAKLNAEQQQIQMQLQFNEMFPPDDLKSFSESTTSDSYNELKNKWFSAEELRKVYIYLIKLRFHVELLIFYSILYKN